MVSLPVPPRTVELINLIRQVDEVSSVGTAKDGCVQDCAVEVESVSTGTTKDGGHCCGVDTHQRTAVEDQGVSASTSVDVTTTGGCCGQRVVAASPLIKGGAGVGTSTGDVVSTRSKIEADV